ncbi:tyrosine-type recombinase/integrase [Halovenus sp. HT40]|uniref:tyrosine-type recombinase/integrase n=1 Tax=Halovenus sp. HT40 TaxID=3126691 RepID=UPI00300F65C8
MFPEFEEYLLDLETGQHSGSGDVSENTIRKRRRELENFEQWVRENRDVTECKNVSGRDVLRYVNHLVDEGYAPNTITNSKWSSVSATFNHLYESNEIEENPVGRISRGVVKDKAKAGQSTDERKKHDSGPKDHLTKAEVYELAEDHVPEPRDRNELLVKLMFWTGCRVSEVLNVTIGDDGSLDGPNSDVFPDVPKIQVYRSKSDSVDVVGYKSKELNPLLYDWCRKGRLRYKCSFDTDALFIGRKGELTQSRVNDIINEAAENMGIQESNRESVDGRSYKRVTPHIFRHSCAMYYRNEEGRTLDDIKAQLGHSKAKTTEEFYSEETEERVVELFS